MKYVPTVNDDSLKSGLAVSVGLHVLLFAFLFITLPRLIPPLPAHRSPIPFEIVTIAEITNTRISTDEAKPSPPPPAAPTAAAPQPQSKPAPEPVKKTQPKIEDIVEALKAVPKPAEKPKPPAEKPAQTQDLLGSVLKDVAKMKPGLKSDQKADSKTSSATEGAGTATAVGPALSTRLTITEEDALRRQIEQCWNPPIGARDAQNLIVEVIIDVNMDRTVANADVVDKGRYASDPFFRAAADAAIRALRNPRCSPLELAPDKYEQWKRINFTFDPRDML